MLIAALLLVPNGGVKAEEQGCNMTFTERNWAAPVSNIPGHYVDGTLGVHIADIDGDGNMDLASASYNDDKIAWYENTNGDGRHGSTRGDDGR